MKIAIISVTHNGQEVARRILENNRNDKLQYTPYALKMIDVKVLFENYEGIVFVCACGIAVRMIAPYVCSKVTDPAVIVIDEQGKFVISLLSGHLGGANILAKRIAESIGAIPVITTATDIGGKFSPDSFAKANNLHIAEMDIAKEIASRIVNNGRIALYSDYPYIHRPEPFFDDTLTDMGICISADKNRMPFAKTLHLIPKNLILGVGCKKDTAFSVFENFILQKFSEYHLPLFRVSEIVSIDLKKNETALQEFSEKYRIPLKFYNAKALQEVKGNFQYSEFVLKMTGVDNVCERSALYYGGKLLIVKQCGNGVTLAVGEKEFTIDFERNML